MAANLLNTLYTLVDLAIIGKFLGSEALSAASNGGQIVFMLYAIGIGLGGGGQILISQLTGAGKRNEYQSTIGTLVTFGVLSAVLTTLVALFFGRPLLDLIRTPAEAVDLGVEYLWKLSDSIWIKSFWQKVQVMSGILLYGILGSIF